MPEAEMPIGPMARHARRRWRRQGILVTAMLVIGAAAAAPAQTVSDVVILGLPPGIAAAELSSTLAEKAGASCTKELEAGDCASIVDALKDLGYLEAQVKAATASVPGGIRLSFTVTPRSRVTIESVQVPGLAKPEVQQLLDGLAIAKDAPCTRAVCQRLSAAVAERLGMNALFLGLDFRISASKHEAVLVFSK
jgi:outer membrane protein assembly factor BamA